MQDCVVWSMDIWALYPSLQVEAAAQIVSEQVVESGIVYEGADMRIAGVYLDRWTDQRRYCQTSSSKEV